MRFWDDAKANKRHNSLFSISFDDFDESQQEVSSLFGTYTLRWDLLPPTRGFFLVRWGFWWFFLPWRRWWWYRVTRNKSAKWFRYDILVCYRSRLENDDHVMTMIWEYGWEVTIKSMIVDLSTDFTELMTDREGDVRTRTLHQKVFRHNGMMITRDQWWLWIMRMSIDHSR